jgi:hypothetical protein
LIGLNRENIESLQRGDVFTLPPGQTFPLSENSDVVVIYEDTDEKLVERMKNNMPAPKASRSQRLPSGQALALR